MKVLLVIDMQAGCFEGEPPRLEEHAVVERINALAEAFRSEGRVLHIQHTDAAEGLERASAAWQILPGIRVHPDDLRVEKEACDAFLETPLQSMLKQLGATQLWITGCATDYCVDTTVRAAASLGFEVTVVADGHTTRDRRAVTAAQVIAHHNDVWSDLLLPRGRRIRVKATEALLRELGSVRP